MFLLDTRTMIFTFATGSLIMAVGLLIVNLRTAHMRLMTLWVAANFALFGAWALYNTPFSFALFSVGYALEFAALSMFCGRRIRPGPFLASDPCRHPA